MARGDVHTVHRDGSWYNQVEGNERASSRHARKEEAVARGRQLAINNRSEHLVHGLDGRIQYRNSYGGDPYPPAG